MPTVNRSNRASGNRTRSEPARFNALRKMAKAVEKAGANLPTARLELLESGLYLTPNGRAVEAYVSDRDEEKAFDGYSRFNRFMVDGDNGVFYAQNYNDTYGPFDLPRGVKAADIADDGRVIPRGKTKYEKSLSKLMHKVRDGLFDARKAGQVDLDYDNGAFRAPDGEALYHHYIDDDWMPERSNTFHMPGGALMLGEEKFWVELIPGVSGQCYGPFEYPRGFSTADIKAKDRHANRASSSSSSSSSTSYDRGSSSTSYATGSDSGSYRRPAPRRTIGGGGSGSWPSSWGPSPGGSGS